MIDIAALPNYSFYLGGLNFNNVQKVKKLFWRTYSFYLGGLNFNNTQGVP